MRDTRDVLNILLKYWNKHRKHHKHPDIYAEYREIWMWGPEPKVLTQDDAEKLAAASAHWDEEIQRWYMHT